MRLSLNAADAYTRVPFDLKDRFPLVAYVDIRRGCIRCPACARDHNGDQEAQYADDYANDPAMHGQVCDMCRASIDAIVTAARIASGWDGMGAPPTLITCPTIRALAQPGDQEGTP
jgi:hypothetical protein